MPRTTSTPSRLGLSALVGLTVLLTAAACGSSGGGSTGGSTGASTRSDTASSASAGGSTVTADLTEFKIALSSETLKAGTYSFVVKNAGKITHALTVDGPGVDATSTGDMSPGSSKTISVTLKAGTYDVFCPVGDHKMEGMDDKVTVS